MTQKNAMVPVPAQFHRASLDWRREVQAVATAVPESPVPYQPWPLATEVEYQRVQEEYRLRLALMETQARLEKLQRAKSANIKISDKGAVSVYGLGRYPVTLYADQWRMLLAQAELIEQFIREHEEDLARKEG